MHRARAIERERMANGPRSGAPGRRWRRTAYAALALAVSAAACGSDPSGPGFTQINLVSNGAGRVPVVDPNLRNPWGLARGPNGGWFVADNQSGVATSYDGTGNPLPSGDPRAITVPAPAGAPPGAQSLPTGAVYNNTTDFVITGPGTALPARFIVCTEDGTIAGWSQDVDPDAAIVAVDNSAAGAFYTGLAIGANGSGSLLYAANFRARTVDVFNRSFAATALSGTFSDPGIPAAFAPFGIQNINGNLFVTYAKRSANQEDAVPGAGNGYVDVFDTDGAFVRRFASQGQLNSPWGIVQAPISFGRFGGAILVGNFGDGQLNAFNPVGGTFLGQVSKPNGDPIAITGLWALAFGNGNTAGSADTLYFTAGPNDQKDGLFGTLRPSPD
jgi:uncharacterized protein (TIGR03118 family)